MNNNFIPNYLREYLITKDIVKDVNREFSFTGRIHCSCGCENFTISREVRKLSNEAKKANQVINNLLIKYKNNLNFPVGNGASLTQIYENGKVYIAYSPHDYPKHELVILEDITDLNKIAMSHSLIPILVVITCYNCGKVIELFNSTYHGYDGCICEEKIPHENIKTALIRKCVKCGANIYKVNISIHHTGFDDIKKDIRKADLSDAFDWISFGLQCSNCNSIHRKFLDLETM